MTAVSTVTNSATTAPSTSSASSAQFSSALANAPQPGSTTQQPQSATTASTPSVTVYLSRGALCSVLANTLSWIDLTNIDMLKASFTRSMYAQVQDIYTSQNLLEIPFSYETIVDRIQARAVYYFPEGLKTKGTAGDWITPYSYEHIESPLAKARYREFYKRFGTDTIGGIAAGGENLMGVFLQEALAGVGAASQVAGDTLAVRLLALRAYFASTIPGFTSGGSQEQRLICQPSDQTFLPFAWTIEELTLARAAIGSSNLIIVGLTATNTARSISADIAGALAWVDLTDRASITAALPRGVLDPILESFFGAGTTYDSFVDRLVARARYYFPSGVKLNASSEDISPFNYTSMPDTLAKRRYQEFYKKFGKDNIGGIGAGGLLTMRAFLQEALYGFGASTSTLSDVLALRLQVMRAAYPAVAHGSDAERNLLCNPQDPTFQPFKWTTGELTAARDRLAARPDLAGESFSSPEETPRSFSADLAGALAWVDLTDRMMISAALPLSAVLKSRIASLFGATTTYDVLLDNMVARARYYFPEGNRLNGTVGEWISPYNFSSIASPLAKERYRSFYKKYGKDNIGGIGAGGAVTMRAFLNDSMYRFGAARETDAVVLALRLQEWRAAFPTVVPNSADETARLCNPSDPTFAPFAWTADDLSLAKAMLGSLRNPVDAGFVQADYAMEDFSRDLAAALAWVDLTDPQRLLEALPDSAGLSDALSSLFGPTMTHGAFIDAMLSRAQYYFPKGQRVNGLTGDWINLDTFGSVTDPLIRAHYIEFYKKFGSDNVGGIGAAGHLRMRSFVEEAVAGFGASTLTKSKVFAWRLWELRQYFKTKYPGATPGSTAERDLMCNPESAFQPFKWTDAELNDARSTLQGMGGLFSSGVTDQTTVTPASFCEAIAGALAWQDLTDRATVILALPNGANLAGRLTALFGITYDAFVDMVVARARYYFPRGLTLNGQQGVWLTPFNYQSISDTFVQARYQEFYRKFGKDNIGGIGAGGVLTTRAFLEEAINGFGAATPVKSRVLALRLKELRAYFSWKYPNAYQGSTAERNLICYPTDPTFAPFAWTEAEWTLAHNTLQGSPSLEASAFPSPQNTVQSFCTDLASALKWVDLTDRASVTVALPEARGLAAALTTVFGNAYDYRVFVDRLVARAQYYFPKGQRVNGQSGDWINPANYNAISDGLAKSRFQEFYRKYGKDVTGGIGAGGASVTRSFLEEALFGFGAATTVKAKVFALRLMELRVYFASKYPGFVAGNDQERNLICAPTDATYQPFAWSDAELTLARSTLSTQPNLNVSSFSSPTNTPDTFATDLAAALAWVDLTDRASVLAALPQVSTVAVAVMQLNLLQNPPILGFIASVAGAVLPGQTSSEVYASFVEAIITRAKYYFPKGLRVNGASGDWISPYTYNSISDPVAKTRFVEFYKKYGKDNVGAIGAGGAIPTRAFLEEVLYGFGPASATQGRVLALRLQVMRAWFAQAYPNATPGSQTERDRLCASTDPTFQPFNWTDGELTLAKTTLASDSNLVTRAFSAPTYGVQSFCADVGGAFAWLNLTDRTTVLAALPASSALSRQLSALFGDSMTYTQFIDRVVAAAQYYFPKGLRVFGQSGDYISPYNYSAIQDPLIKARYQEFYKKFGKDNIGAIGAGGPVVTRAFLEEVLYGFGASTNVKARVLALRLQVLRAWFAQAYPTATPGSKDERDLICQPADVIFAPFAMSDSELSLARSTLAGSPNLATSSFMQPANSARGFTTDLAAALSGIDLTDRTTVVQALPEFPGTTGALTALFGSSVTYNGLVDSLVARARYYFPKGLRVGGQTGDFITPFNYASISDPLAKARYVEFYRKFGKDNIDRVGAGGLYTMRAFLDEALFGFGSATSSKPWVFGLRLLELRAAFPNIAPGSVAERKPRLRSGKPLPNRSPGRPRNYPWQDWRLPIQTTSTRHSRPPRALRKASTRISALR